MRQIDSRNEAFDLLPPMLVDTSYKPVEVMLELRAVRCWCCVGWARGRHGWEMYGGFQLRFMRVGEKKRDGGLLFQDIYVSISLALLLLDVVRSCWRTADRQTTTVQRRMWQWSRQWSQACKQRLS